MKTRISLPNGYTPGPWISDSEGNLWGEDGDNSHPIASVSSHYNRSFWSGVLTEKESANADLIAAAPQLLAALDHCEWVLRATLSKPKIGRRSVMAAIRIAQSAIAKTNPPEHEN